MPFVYSWRLDRQLQAIVRQVLENDAVKCMSSKPRLIKALPTELVLLPKRSVQPCHSGTLQMQAYGLVLSTKAPQAASPVF